MAPKCDSRTLYDLCTSADIVAVQQGVQRLGECLMAVARAQLNPNRYDYQAVEDCVQNAIIAIWTMLEKGEGPEEPGAFMAYAVKTTKNKCIDRVRHDGRRPPTIQMIDEAAIDAILDHGLPLDEEFIYLAASINNHKRLSENSKKVLIGGYLLDMSEIDLAKELATAVPNVGTIRHRNLKKLRSDHAFMTALRKYFDNET